MPNIPVDTPDYQRGIVNPQVALSTGHAGTGVADVTIPPNCEALIVVLVNPAATDSVAVTGDTTGFSYPGIASFTNKAFQSSRTWFFDVTSTLDQTCTVHVVAQNGGAWAVYADAGVHIVGDVARYTNHNGSQYVVSTIPNVEAGDHPPNELQKAASIFNSTTNATIVATPGAGLRLRLFSVSLFANSNWVYVSDNTGVAITGVSANSNSVWQSHPQGLPLATNSPFVVGGAGAGGTTGICTVQYTVETV